MDIIERAARALASLNDGNYDEEQWEMYVPDVHAVLAAIREPDEGMIEAGLGSCAIGWPDAECRDVLPEIWMAMIDKILREK
jgi:hypothetical protein